MTLPEKTDAAAYLKEDYVDNLIEQWRVESPELDVGALHIFGRLHRLYLMYNHAISATFEQYGINAAGFDVLSTLKRSGGDYTLTPTQLAEYSLVTSGGISLRLNRLEDAGLVKRTREKSDRRSVHVRLTAKGQKLISEVAKIHFAREDEMMAGLTTEEVDDLAELLRKLGSSVKEYLWGDTSEK